MQVTCAMHYKLTKQALEVAVRADSGESGALWLENAALREAAFGDRQDAKEQAEYELKLYPKSREVQAEAALVFAMAGDTARAESLAQNFSKRFPLDTQMHSLWLPAIQAQLALNQKNPALALNVLQIATRPLSWGKFFSQLIFPCLYHVYVRGEAHLAARQGNASAAQFQKILDHSGIV